MSSEFVSVYDYKAKAKNILPLNALGYYDSGAGSEYSLRLNCDAFEKWGFLNVLINNRDL